MSVILNIDTAVDVAYTSISKNGEVLAEVSNKDQKDHGRFLQPAIRGLLDDLHIDIKELDAIAVSAGPGSYTGLRVGMASAKGLCYALNKPLITLGTLEILAFAAILETRQTAAVPPMLFCPMIDARRMEVFTALYDQNMVRLIEPCAMILDQNSFANMLLKNNILFFGNGAEKWKLISGNKNAYFAAFLNNTLAMSKLGYKKYEYNDFTDLAYSEPLYLKEFFTSSGQL